MDIYDYHNPNDYWMYNDYPEVMNEDESQAVAYGCLYLLATIAVLGLAAIVAVAIGLFT